MDINSIYPKQLNQSSYKLKANSCFVIMPFSNDLDNTYTIIQSVANSLNISCTRADTVKTASEPILYKICTQIKQAYFIIVDISNLNPNVFYELGIAHVLRDAKKIFIIKDEETVCPVDIGHLHYYTYNKSNLKNLKSIIEQFFTENNILEDLQSILSFLDLLPQNNQTLSREFMTSLDSCVGSNLECLIAILNNQKSDLLKEQILMLLSALTDKLNALNQLEEMYRLFSSLILLIITKIHTDYDITNYLSNIYNKKYNNLSNEWIADCSIILLDHSTYFDITISWILEYLKNISPVEFDIAKYKLEIGIIQAKSKQIDEKLVNKLQSPNKTLAEHCAKFIKERKIYKALPILLELICSEKNPYVFRNCLDALIEISPLNVLLDVQNICQKRKNYIDKNDFLYKHIRDLQNKISVLQNTTNC